MVVPDPTLVRQMVADGREYRRTGGVHCAALGNGDGILHQSEDIGRHNAVDKVVGWGFLRDIPLNRLQLLTTGRVSSDMVAKAARAGIPVVISLSIPTSLAVEIAHRTGITLIGRAGRAKPVNYS